MPQTIVEKFVFNCFNWLSEAGTHGTVWNIIQWKFKIEAAIPQKMIQFSHFDSINITCNASCDGVTEWKIFQWILIWIGGAILG